MRSIPKRSNAETEVMQPPKMGLPHSLKALVSNRCHPMKGNRNMTSAGSLAMSGMLQK